MVVDVVELPALSVATAVTEYVPGLTLVVFQMALYGLVLSVASLDVPM
jgi:hypothetical protein